MSPTTTHDDGPTRPIEDRLRDALRTEATGADASPAVWDAIRSAADTVVVPLDEGRRPKGAGDGRGRDGDRHRGQALLLAVAACVAVALIVAGVVLARRDAGRDVYVGPTTTATPNPGGTASTLVGPVSPPTSDLGRALWATAALRSALEDEQLATVAARYGLRPDSELRLVDARAATDAAASTVAEQVLPRLGEGDTEVAARQAVVSRMRNLAVVREAATRVGGDTRSILGQYDQTVEAVAVVARILSRTSGVTQAGSPAVQRANVPAQLGEWLTQSSSVLISRAAEDQPGEPDQLTQQDIARRKVLFRDAPDALADWPGADDESRAVLRASVNDPGLPAERLIVDRLAAGQTAGGPQVATELLTQTEARLAELRRFEQTLISRL